MIQPTPCAIWCLNTSFHGHLMRWTTTQPPCKPYPKSSQRPGGSAGSVSSTSACETLCLSSV